MVSPKLVFKKRQLFYVAKKMEIAARYTHKKILGLSTTIVLENILYLGVLISLPFSD